MQFETCLHAQTPRTKCPACGIKVIHLPWATKSSGFTLLFESFAIAVLQASLSVQEARKLLRLNWHQVEQIKKKAVERGINRREELPIRYLGIDEKPFKKRHRYVSLLYDLDGSRVLDVEEGRTLKSAQTLIDKALSEKQKGEVKAVAADMWKAYLTSVKHCLPTAKIVHDKFHLFKHLNEAVDTVRKEEHRMLLLEKGERLKGSRYLWLSGFENLSEEAQLRFEDISCCGLKIACAWHHKELFSYLWDYRSKGWASRYLDEWCRNVMRSRLAPLKEVVRMFRAHEEGILNYFDHRITNAGAEGMNLKIQKVRSNARGYRSFESFRTSILFYCGKLDMALSSTKNRLNRKAYASA